MSFDIQKFESTNYADRTEDVPVGESEPELIKLFKEKKPVWKIKGLTGLELAVMREAVTKNRDIESMVEMLASRISKDKIDAVKKAFGMSDDAPADWVRRIQILRLGSVDPDLKKKQDLVVRIGETFPITFSTLTDRIIALTGQGKTGEL